MLIFNIFYSKLPNFYCIAWLETEASNMLNTSLFSHVEQCMNLPTRLFLPDFL